MEVGVVGAGAAGCVAAIALSKGGANVVLFEKNEKTGKKLYITGKGRCNLTNACDAADFFENTVHGAKFLQSAIHGFTPADAMEFFEGLGVPLQVERGNRVFPVSQKSSDVIRALNSELKRLGVTILLDTAVTGVTKKEDGKFCVRTSQQEYTFDRVIIATGGVSYPSTGSTGDGYKFAKAFGHSVADPRPALVALHTVEPVGQLEGLSLKNVSLSAYSYGEYVTKKFGELLFTDKGISGPIALTISSYIARLDDCALILDLKPALTPEMLDARLLREFDLRRNCEVKSVMRALLPERLNVYLLERAGVSPSTKVNSLTKEQRKRIATVLKAMPFKVKGPAPFSEAVITSGGVNLSELKNTGESRLVDGLYFVGETIDADALTGGFNLQIAWATGICAARAILKSAQK